jgi:hypothetical protein
VRASAFYTSAYVSLSASAMPSGLGLSYLSPRTTFETFWDMVSTGCTHRHRSGTYAAIGGLTKLRPAA